MSTAVSQTNWDLSDSTLATLLETSETEVSSRRQMNAADDLDFNDVDPGNLFMVLGRT